MAALNAITVPVLGGITDIAARAVAAAAAGDTAPVGDGLFLYVGNADASSHTVTVATPGTVNGLAVADATLVVAAGKTGMIPLTNIFRDATGRAAITYSSVTATTVAVFKLGV
jgi:hypothetical protein